MTMHRRIILAIMLASFPGVSSVHAARPGDGLGHLSTLDSSLKAAPGNATATAAPVVNLWGLDILISNGGFGAGVAYRREFTPDLAGTVSLSVSEAKDDKEVEMYNPYTGASFTPGKLNRFLVIPLMAGVQYRVFREEIVDTFRPYVNGGVGPAMIYQMPYVTLQTQPSGPPQIQEVEFFESIGMGHPEYALGGFIGAGAYFGGDPSSSFGLNVRYYFISALGEGLPSQYDPSTGYVTGYKKDFGGFFITLNVGMGF